MSKIANLNKTIEKISGLDLSSKPSIEKIFSNNIELKSVPGIHQGLMSSDNLYSDEQITGIWLQGISEDQGKKDGRIMEHDHNDTSENEIVITAGDSVYAGLGEPVATVGDYKIFSVKAGVRHGNNTSPSHGRWVSIKFK